MTPKTKGKTPKKSMDCSSPAKKRKGPANKKSGLKRCVKYPSARPERPPCKKSGQIRDAKTLECRPKKSRGRKMLAPRVGDSDAKVAKRVKKIIKANPMKDYLKATGDY